MASSSHPSFTRISPSHAAEAGAPRSAVDQHVGARAQRRRLQMGITVERLGDALNLTALQVQRIENGERRAGAATLYDLSRILGVPISYFFGDKGAAIGEPQGGNTDGSGDLEADPMLRVLWATDETRQLVHAFRQVEPTVRPRILALIKSMAPL